MWVLGSGFESREFLAQGVLEPLDFRTVHLAKRLHFRLGLGTGGNLEPKASFQAVHAIIS